MQVNGVNTQSCHTERRLMRYGFCIMIISISIDIDSNPNSILARFDLSRAPADQDLLQYKVFEEEAEFEESDTERVTGAEHCASDSSSDESVDDAIGDGPTADAKATHV